MIDLDGTIKRLRERKGEWAKIARASGIPYDTLQKIADGRVKSPTITTINKLIPALRRRIAK